MSLVPDYLLIGHLTADLTPHGRILGGTVSYAARTVAAFGLRVAVLTSAATPEPLLDELKRYAHDVVVVPSAETSTFENIYGAQGRQQYIRGVASVLHMADVPPAWLAAPLVHLAPLTGELDPAEFLAGFASARTLMTAQGLLRQWDETGLVRFKRWLEPSALAALGWLVLSEEDILQAPELESEYAAVVEHLVMTRAEYGGTHYQNGNPTAYTTPHVEVIQPTGAGDVFAAALLASLHLLDGDIRAALSVAARLGAIAVTRDGWEGAPTAEEVQHALALARANTP